MLWMKINKFNLCLKKENKFIVYIDIFCCFFFYFIYYKINDENDGG